MIVYQTDADGYYVGPVHADPSPLEADVWLVPGGCVTEAPPEPPEGHRARWTGAQWQVEAPVELEPDPEPEAPTARDVIAERDRRLALGFDYDFGDARGIHRIGTTTDDRRGWQEVTDASNAAIALGQPYAEFTIVTDTGPAVITAMEWQAILVAATGHRQPIWQASFGIQALDPIPADYAADERWP